MHLLDTDTLTHLYKGNSNVVRQLSSVEDPEVGITIISEVPTLILRIQCRLPVSFTTALLGTLMNNVRYQKRSESDVASLGFPPLSGQARTQAATRLPQVV